MGKINIMERNVMIVPVGLEKDRIIDGCTAYPINVLYLINNPRKIKNEPLPSVYKYSLDFSKKILKYFSNSHILINTEEAILNSLNECLIVLRKIYSNEIKFNNLKHIYINISTASKSFALAAYFFALFHQDIISLFYLKTSEYIILDYLQKSLKEDFSIDRLREEFNESGLTKGPYKIDEIPMFPVIEISQDQMDLIKILSTKDEFSSLNDFMRLLPEKFKSENRVQIRRLLASLEKKNLITVKKVGRKSKIIVYNYLKTLSIVI